MRRAAGSIWSTLDRRLASLEVHHALTGLPAAWLLRLRARFGCATSMSMVAHEVAERIDLRLNERGANVQLIGPDDRGVFMGRGRDLAGFRAGGSGAGLSRSSALA